MGAVVVGEPWPCSLPAPSAPTAAPATGHWGAGRGLAVLQARGTIMQREVPVSPPASAHLLARGPESKGYRNTGGSVLRTPAAGASVLGLYLGPAEPGGDPHLGRRV